MAVIAKSWKENKEKANSSAYIIKYIRKYRAEYGDLDMLGI